MKRWSRNARSEGRSGRSPGRKETPLTRRPQEDRQSVVLAAKWFRNFPKEAHTVGDPFYHD
jgi:hypothetical protein